MQPDLTFVFKKCIDVHKKDKSNVQHPRPLPTVSLSVVSVILGQPQYKNIIWKSPYVNHGFKLWAILSSDEISPIPLHLAQGVNHSFVRFPTLCMLPASYSHLVATISVFRSTGTALMYDKNGLYGK